MKPRRIFVSSGLTLLLAVLLPNALLPAMALAQGADTIKLWPGAAPDGPGPSGAERRSASGSITNVAEPYLVVHRPAKPNGTAMLVISGGGYAHIETGKESAPAADWLAGLGVVAFELVYRLPGEGWASSAAPLQDGQRAMRLIRSRASHFGIDPQRIGIMGFSAGAHLAGMTAALPDVARYAGVDAADQLPARPAFAALIYPVLTMQQPFDQTHAKKSLLGGHPTQAMRDAYSVELQVGAGMAPVFLAQALDDPIAPIDNSLLMAAALRAAKVPVESHLFQSGGHGWGMGKAGTPVHAWPQLFQAWAGKNGFLKD